MSATTGLPAGFTIEKVRPQNTYLWDLFWHNQWCGTFRTKKAATTEAHERMTKLISEARP